MSGAVRIPGDEAVVSVRVDVAPAETFRVFTEEIDQWWRRGLAYRVGGKGESVLALEPRLGGRLLERYRTASGEREVQTGNITAWEPPARLVFQWRAVNFAPTESTEVEVRFDPSGAGTLVTVTHRGWSKLRADHPVRHGQDVPAFIHTIGMWWADLMTSMRVHVKQEKAGS